MAPNFEVLNHEVIRSPVAQASRPSLITLEPGPHLVPKQYRRSMELKVLLSQAQAPVSFKCLVYNRLSNISWMNKWIRHFIFNCSNQIFPIPMGWKECQRRILNSRGKFFPAFPGDQALMLQIMLPYLTILPQRWITGHPKSGTMILLLLTCNRQTPVKGDST